MAVVKKAVLFLGIFFIMASLEAKEHLTRFGQYSLSALELDSYKTFFNQTGKPLVLAWQTSIPNKDIEYSQHIIVEAGSSYKLDLSRALAYFKSKGFGSYKSYDVKLFVGVVVRSRGNACVGLNCRSLKWSENGLGVVKGDFLKSGSFILKKTKKGKLFYEAKV